MELGYLLHTFESWRRITDDTWVVFYDHRVGIVLITWCSESWWLITSEDCLLSLWEILLEVTEVVVVECKCCIIVTWSDIVWTIVCGSIVYTVSTDRVVGYKSSIYIELAIRYLE